MQTAGSKFSNFFRGRGSEPSKGYGMGGISENQSGFCSPAGSSFTFPDRMTVRYVTLSNRSIDSPDDTPTEDLVPVHTTDRSDRTQSSEIVKDGDHEQESLSSKLRNGLNLFSNKTLLPLQQLTDASCRIVVDNAPWMTSSPPRETDSSANRRASNSSLCSLGAGDSAGDSSSSRRASLLSPLSNLSLGWPASGPSNCVPDVAGRTISGSVVQQEVVIGKEDQFWVPVSVTPQKKRAQSLIPPTLTFTSDSNVEGSSVTGIANESSPHPASHVAAAAAAIGQRSPLYSPSAEGFDVLAPGLLDPGDVDGPMQARRRRASMHEALDHRKIDASLYERPPSLVSSKQTIGHNVREENLGCIGFSMKYSPDQSLLTVRLLAARDLTLSHDTSRDASDMTPSSAINPFIRVCLLPDQRNGFQSTIQRNTTNPRFDEEFLFEMIQSVPWNRSLHFQIFHADNKDSTSGARLIGHVIVPLENSELTKQGTIWKGVSQDPENKKLEPYVGDLMFAISYLPSAERLSVAIIKARNLKPHDPTGKSSTNPFVRVSLMNGSKKTKRKRTSSKKNSLNPEWNEALTFGLTREQLNGSHGKLTLELFVHSDNLLGSDEDFNGDRPLPSEYEETFKMFDNEGMGGIELTHLATALRVLGSNPTEAEIDESNLVAAARVNEDGLIEFDEFCDIMRQHQKSLDVEREELMTAFSYFDKDGTGKVDPEELKQVLTSSGEGRMSDDDVMELFADLETDDNGLFDYKDVVHKMIAAEK